MGQFFQGIEGRDCKVFRSFEINGKITTDTTYRTEIIEYFTRIRGRKFLDMGGADGYEARALSVRGAAQAVTLEAKDSAHQQAKKSEKLFEYKSYKALNGDARIVDTLGLGHFDVVLCFGFLYHMANPYNVLKRIANVTDDLLLLETHVAPDYHEEAYLVAKHRGALMHKFKTLYLDGEKFEGRICIHRGDHNDSKGSLDENWSFWLTQSSLIKALTRSGFEILNWYYELDKLTPPVIAHFGSKLGFGSANTKVFVVARVRPDLRPKNILQTISTLSEIVAKPDISESFIDKLYFKSNLILNKFRKN